MRLIFRSDGLLDAGAASRRCELLGRYVLDTRLMSKFAKLLFVVGTTGAAVVGCGGPMSPARAPSESTSTPPGSAAQEPARPSLTADACEASGGSIVGDIGDGAIHRPEYRCPNGAKPSGSISAEPGGPIAIEGSVCCPR